MPRLPIVFGGGLDRETGVLAMQVGGMEDIRNVHLLMGKALVRRGFERVITFVDGSSVEQTHALAGISVLGRREAIYVTYDAVNYKVNLFHGDGAGTWANWFAEWPFKRDDNSDILGPLNPDPPIISIAEYNGVVIVAHQAAAVGSRAQTYFIYYDTGSSAYVANPLTVDWPLGDPTPTTHKVRFRGVLKHLEYILGWGWGSDVDVRPELVRVSQPAPYAQLLVNGDAFNEHHYWIVGDEGDPVVACRRAGRSVLAFKETETYELYGSSALNFGQDRIDEDFGLLEPRLAFSHLGAVFAWTQEGPRLFSAEGPSESLEIPLELTMPEPFDLVEQGESKYAFAFYFPVYRSIWFVFGKRVYALYIRAPGDWKWAYHELGKEMMSATDLPQAGYGTLTAPTGYPSNPTAGSITDTTLDVTVTNNSQDGDETLELWLKPGGGAWELHKGVDVGGGATTVIPLTGIKAGWYYDMAVRYRRGPFYTAGYEGSDPDTWPASARGSFTTTLAALPTIDQTYWTRASATIEQIGVTVTPPYTGTGYDVEWRRNGSVTVFTKEDISGQHTYLDPGITGEQSHLYDVRLVTPYVTGAYTSQVNRWAGPNGPTIDSIVAGSGETYDCYFANGQSGVYCEAWDDYPGLAGSPITLRHTGNLDATYFTAGPVTGADGLEIDVWLRAKATAFGIDDHSDYVGPVSITIFAAP